MKGTPNWERIKAEYLKGGTSYRKLAADHQVSESTLTKRAIRESWERDRQQVGSDVAAAMPGRVQAAVLADAVSVVADHHEGWAEFAKAAREGLAAAKGDPRAIRELAGTYKLATEGQRTALGLNDENKTPADAASAGAMPGVIILPADDPLWAEHAAESVRFRASFPQGA